MTNLDLTADELRLLNLIPADGSTIGRLNLQNQLSWTDEQYWPIRDQLVDRGIVARGRGRGGTLRRLVEADDMESVSVPRSSTPEAQAEFAVELIRREEELYDPLRQVLANEWSKDHRFTPLAVEVTARQGRRLTGGVWSRPDIVSVEVRTFQYLPHKVLEVRTFEVKPADAIDVQAVYEALAHRRAATHSCVILHVPLDKSPALDEEVQAVRAVARSHGVGVIIVDDPSDYATWDEVEEAQRFDPDPERLEAFLDTQLTPATKAKITRATR